MIEYHAKKGFEILREGGPRKLYKACLNYPILKHQKFKLLNIKNTTVQKLKYDAPASPHKIITINPNDIEYILRHDDKILPRPKTSGLGRIKGGNWDDKKYLKEIHEHPVIYGFEERFIQGKNWEETIYWKHFYQQARSRDRHKKAGFDTIEEYLNARCRSYQELYNNIKKEGYKTGCQGKRKDPSKNQPLRSRLEILVNIDRSGNIYLFDGLHRFGIARVLDIEIPAHISCRHKQWQEIREFIYNNGFLFEQNKELRNHPDLQDIMLD